ncbi:adenylate/guanylate cyclase domain-containing protein [Arvimicrobium flavum]|uniref:adenylate/guanylate cyclase domain-containing protein n=1 Tax=Arvimicrobium flavum TaxID=3393320 RepID=UPI00237C0080|nr:adenylate/guanylate cyclase domain-containing protein [Mesorhizobium shangrilense]
MSALLREVITGNTFELADFTLIGRSEGVTIRLSDAGVSRQHATIRKDGAHYWLIDLGSANGSYVNEVALTSARVLADGDRIRLADCVLIFTSGIGATRTTGPASPNTTMSQLLHAPVATQAMTMFVADLKGFTQISALLSAEQVADLLREWYADCRAVLREFGASIDKFIGDCVFAYWHGTEPAIRLKALHAAEALRAVEIWACSPTRQLLRDEYGITLDCRIGLHVGEAAIGSMGKETNTALGDAVNVAFSVEALTRVVDRPALASAAFIEDWAEGHDLFERCGSHPIKGHAEAVEVFAPKRLRV